MNYQEAIDWLFTQFSNYQIQGKKAYKEGLDNIIALCNELDNPQEKFKSIHIAGTNGKGSTSNMLASVLQEAGYKVGLFTSPHLKSFTERIKINGKDIQQDFVLDFIHKIQAKSEKVQPSFFEITTAMAFEYFTKSNVDIAVIEVGLGGRLDATNIITPEICAITSISMDHTNVLGNSLEKIAIEKCGIIKPNIPIIDGEMNPEIKKIIKEKAKEKNAEYIDATIFEITYKTDLQGLYQHQNLKTTIATLRQLQNKNWKLTENDIENGLKNVKKNTNLRGRWEIIQEESKVIFDVAHNIAGFEWALKQLKSLKYNKLHFVLGFVKEKNIESIIAILPKNGNYYFVKPSIERALSPSDYEELLQKYNLNYVWFDDSKSGFQKALQLANKQDVIFVGGSNFLIADLL